MPKISTPQTSGKGEALPTDTHQPEQLSLPAIPLPPFAPRWPNPHTNDYIALELFLAGEFVNVERFRQLTDSTQLAVAVGRLKRMGWPIERRLVPEPSRRRKSRQTGLWFLPKKYRAQVQAMEASE